ncbi:MAG: ROK family protein [Acidimicrobiales bacterium]|nr:ROK family protein [Acidimicrobiales bacterium]
MICGIDVGGTKTLGVAIDASGAITAESRRPTPTTASDLVDTLTAVVAGLERSTGTAPTAVGVGIAGIVTADAVRYSPNIPGVIEYPLRAELADRLGLPVVLGNDANAMAVAEHRVGAGRGVDDLLLVALGTGIGTGFILDGRLYRGAHGFAGEAGHMVVDRDGPLYHTDERGPWELFASGTAFGALAERLVADGSLPYEPGTAGRSLSSELASSPSAAAQAALDEFAADVALGVRNLIYVLDPARIVLSGGLVEIGEPLRAAVEAAVGRNLLGREHRPAVPVALASLGVASGAQGAALLAADLSET